MIAFSRRKSNKNGTRKKNLSTKANRLMYRPKPIVALLISCSLLYFLSFLNVAVRMHELDHMKDIQVISADKMVGKEISFSKNDNNVMDNKMHQKEKEVEKSDVENVARSSEGDDDNNNDDEGEEEKKEQERENNNNDDDDDDDEEEEEFNVEDEKRNQAFREFKNRYSPLPEEEEFNLKAEKRNQAFREFKNRYSPLPQKEENDLLAKKVPNALRGDLVMPEIIVEGSRKIEGQNPDSNDKKVSDDQILTAYLEITDRSTWETKPLPVRKIKADDLIKTQYPKLNSCSRLPEQWPVDDYPAADPFLPWIHDVFPTEDGKFIQFVAQNRRRCHTGTTKDEALILFHTAPQVALFQHVPLKKVQNATEKEEPRYRLCSHEDADPESLDTRFFCRFKPSGDITFSEFNNDYEWAATQKRQKNMFTEAGRDNSGIHTSQLIFRCPVPDHLVELVRTGDSVQDDWATIFVDLIPVRTPPRYGVPDQFLVPRYAKSQHTSEDKLFDAHEEWGEEHILPRLDDSGRWENIPVCKPPMLTYEPQALMGANSNESKKHHLVSCLWASTGYTTRGNRYAINDGQRRLLEWITYNKIIGFDHFYIYDNSGAFDSESSLQPIADLFPEDVTLINWPSKICNNNPNFDDSVGERSSQYAAETSCRLRFGPHTNWIGQFDIDEYLIPMGNFSSVLPLLEKLDEEGNKIINFASWRAWPRRTHINDPEETTHRDRNELCGYAEECFELSIRRNTTMLEAYNCDREKPGEKKATMPAEKQIYRSDYVKQHFIHYSTITESSNLNKSEFKEKFGNVRPFPDPLSRFSDEVNEGLMLHSKSVARQDTAGWKDTCTGKGYGPCRIGFPWPDYSSNATFNKDGWKYNCYVNPRIDNYFAPKLRAKLTEMGFSVES